MNVTQPAKNVLESPMYGYIAIVICAIGFGTNYLPVKKFKMGDGMFFQWMMSNAILLVGVIVNLSIEAPQFYPLSMLGGFLWATGNATIVIIIDMIGVGLGILIWSMANMLFGFASSRFGWFGINPKIPAKPIMNYIGVGIALGSVLIYAAIKPNRQEPQNKPIDEKEFDQFTIRDSEVDGPEPQVEDIKDERKGIFRFCKPLNELPMWGRRLMGILLSVVAGALFGNSFVPTIYIQDHVLGASKGGLDYVFSHFVGIWITSTGIFIIYAILTMNQPWIPSPNAIVPALASGVLWALAQSAWFVANAALGEPITFPIVTTVPAFIATMCGLIFFREITGKRNYILLGCAFCVTTVGVVLNALSR